MGVEEVLMLSVRKNILPTNNSIVLTRQEHPCLFQAGKHRPEELVLIPGCRAGELEAMLFGTPKTVGEEEGW